MGKQKFYVVWEGRKKGIFTSWKECKKQINGLKGVKYKSFMTKEMAEKAFKGNPFDFIGKNIKESTLSKEELSRIGVPDTKSISVDGACNNKGVAEYQGVFTDTKTKLFRLGPFVGGSNNLMEFLALVHALAYCKQHNISLPIYSDSRTAMAWVRRKKINTTINRTSTNTKVFELVDRAIYWLHHNTYNNKILKWETKAWGEIPADFGRK